MNSFFILGNPRSGTTLLRLMLNNHPKMVVPPECGLIQWWSKKYGNWEVKDNTLRVDEFLDDLKNSKKIETWNLDYQKLKQQITNQLPVSYSELCELIYVAYAHENIKNFLIKWGDKNNYYINHLDLIHDLYPKAKFIHIIRDGRDVACSYIDMNKLPNDLKYKPNLTTDIIKIADEWKTNNLKILYFFEKLKRQNYITIKFEDLILNSNLTLKKISTFLEVPFDEKMLNYHFDNRQKNIEPKETLSWKMKTLKKPDLTVIRRYKNQLSKSDIYNFELIASSLLTKYGYLPND